MSKVLIAINFDEGLYNFRRELVTKLIERGHEVHLVMPHGEYTDRLVDMGCVFHDVPLNRRGTNPKQELQLLRAYWKVLTVVKPDSVLTYTIKPNVYMGMLCRLKKLKYMPTITGLGTAVEGEGRLQKFTRSLYKIAMKGANTVFFQNQDNMDLFSREKIGLNYKLLSGSGVNLSRYVPENFPIEGKPEFIYISRVMKEKGIEQYMDAAEHFAGKAKFTVLGFLEDDYENKTRFEDLVKKGIIEFPGSVEDVRPYIAKSRCLIHPSFYPEGMSNVCMEAAACGRAIITTDHNGCKQTIIDGETGYLVKCQNSEDLIEKIEKFMAMGILEQEKMGLAGRKYMEDNFDRNKVVMEYIRKVEEE